MATFGTINNPLPSSYGEVNTGLPSFVSNLLTVIYVAGGLFVLFNLIFAGFTYMSAAGDKGKLEKALSSINMSVLGLLVMVAAGVLTGIISFLLFNDATFILKPTIEGPGGI